MMSELGDFIRTERERQGLGVRELCRLVEQRKARAGKEISSAYLSQVETGWAPAEKVSLDFLWAVGVGLEVDPLHLFVLARPNIDQRYLDPKERAKLFRAGR